MKDTLSLPNFVTVTNNNSKRFFLEELVQICKRKKNPKRDFLFVNPLQGKHLHVNPAKTFQLFDELVSAITNSVNPHEKIIVIGLAETATAIGHYIASSLPNCIYYMQTTREEIPNAKFLLEFLEEHSHATEQFLYGDVSKLNGCDRIIFVDDEVSTGKTELNFIREIEQLGLHLRYGVASLQNWQDDAWTQKFKDLNIDTYFVLKGKLNDLSAKVNVKPSENNVVYPHIIPHPKVLLVKNAVSDFVKERTGAAPYNLHEFTEEIYSSVSSALAGNMPDKDDAVLVLGTEEYMFTPMVFAKALSEHVGVDIQFHATTRSPIETSEECDYAIQNRYPIASCYDSARNTYIYNLEKYDRVYIMTDVIPNCKFVEDISAALALAGCDIGKVFIVSLTC